MQLEGTICVVTGGASGIGRALAFEFSRRGAAGVVIADIDGELCAKVAERIEPVVPTLAVTCDVGDPLAVQDLVDRSMKHFGRIDIFCSNAGYSDPVTWDLSSPIEVFENVTRVNLMAHVSAAKAVLPSMVERGSGYAHGASVGSNDVLARHSRLVVIEVDNESPDLGGPLIEGNIIATISRPPAGLTKSVTARPPDDIDALIGKRVVELLPDEPTMQFGSGGFGDGIAASIQRPISIWSGLATESMAQLNARGLLTGPITAAYAWGADALLHLAQSKMLRLVSVTETHDLTILSSKPRFVSCNTALQVSLDGDVNVERIGGRIIAPLGGHADFCTGASRSVGGMSIIAVRSTTANGISNIVNRCEVVSTARSDIQFVVTEHGVADLRDINDAERSRRLINIAAPEHRAMLATQREITF